ncbi:hypothetical protein [Streptomyces sp. NPDC048282]|uniref:hypothetical protein n=1 Tax=Streptomyces sp. NPDC048282 TaxID=3365528 RepID=UPI00371D56F4
MGWGNIRERLRGGEVSWSRDDLGAAAAVGAAQLPAAAVLWWAGSSGGDDYGAGSGGALGAACFLVFGWLLLPVLGVVQAFVLTRPAVVLARLAARRPGGPSWAWHLAAPAAPAVLWGGLAALLWSWPLTATVPALTALGVLPALGVGYVRRRSWRPAAVWRWAVPGSIALFLLALGGGTVATEAGLIRHYAPPKLTAAQLTGVWRGDDGAELRLRADGGAEAVDLPAQPPFDDDEFRDYVVCEGPGTWLPDAGSSGTGRDGVLLSLDGDCGESTHWSIGGSETSPELFVLFGDPDGGSLRILERAEG